MITSTTTTPYPLQSTTIKLDFFCLFYFSSLHCLCDFLLSRFIDCLQLCNVKRDFPIIWCKLGIVVKSFGQTEFWKLTSAFGTTKVIPAIINIKWYSCFTKIEEQLFYSMLFLPQMTLTRITPSATFFLQKFCSNFFCCSHGSL